MLWLKESKDFQNFVCMKVLEECCKEGFIEKIKYVDVLEDYFDLLKDLNEKVIENIIDLFEKLFEKIFEEILNIDVGLLKQGLEDKFEVMESLFLQVIENIQMEIDDLLEKEEK